MHMKRYTMPKSWPLPRKAETFVATPMPGPHPKQKCIPLKIIIRDIMKFAETSAEVKKILNTGKVFVDKKVRKEPNFPVGLMDIIEIPDLQARYRINIDRKGFAFEKLSEEEAGFKLCKIIGKTTLKGGLQQLNLHDGRNILSKEKYNVGDSVIIELPGQKIIKHYSLKKGEPAFIIAGRNMGAKGRIKEIKQRKSMLEKSTVTIESDKGKAIETPKGYIMLGETSGTSPEKKAEV
jgi:small subunit ribosomal protein S4e